MHSAWNSVVTQEMFAKEWKIRYKSHLGDRKSVEFPHLIKHSLSLEISLFLEQRVNKASLLSNPYPLSVLGF